MRAAASRGKGRESAPTSEPTPQCAVAAALPAASVPDADATPSTMDDSKPRLGYWDNRTIVEPIRLLLALAEIDYVDVRYPVGPPPEYAKTQWQAEKFSLGLDAPNLPYWIEPGPDGLRLTQSRAVLYHIASTKGLAGESPKRRALVMMAVEALADWGDAFMKVTYVNVDVATAEPGVHSTGEPQARATSPEFERVRSEYLAKKLPTHLGHVARMLAHSDGSGAPPTGWLVGSPTPTCADVMLFEYIDQHLAFAPGFLDSDPRLTPLREHHARVLSLPEIAAYRDSARFKPEPMHNRYSQFHRGWLPADPWARRDLSAPALAPTPGRSQPYGPPIHTTPAGAVFITNGRAPVDEGRSSSAYAREKRREQMRDVFAFFCLTVCLIILIAIGRTAITFSPEQEAETELNLGPAVAQQ